MGLRLLLLRFDSDLSPDWFFDFSSFFFAADLENPARPVTFSLARSQASAADSVAIVADLCFAAVANPFSLGSLAVCYSLASDLLILFFCCF